MKVRIFIFLVSLGTCLGCIQLLDGWKQVSIEERARRAEIVFHGLTITTIPDSNPVTYTAQFWIINVYKGADVLSEYLQLDPGNGGVYNLRDRRINVTQFGDKAQCFSPVAPQKYYIVFAEMRANQLVAKYDDLFGAAADWTQQSEERVWSGVGWEPWSDWSACSASCGEGTQERRRFCRQSGSCHGYNKERRRCNMFSCQGAVYPLDIEDRRYYHPSSRAQWERVPGRPTAWRLHPYSYMWVPSSELFPAVGHSHTGSFPREFTLLVTLRIHPQGLAQGTVFSLRSRRQQDTYLSLELAGPDRVKLVHAGPNGTQAVDIPAALGDGNWHQLAVGLHDDSSVRTYLDCGWLSTDILKRNSLDTPDDADIVIGYLFMGDLEQLAIVPNPSAVSQQCSATRVPLLDPALLQTTGSEVSSGVRERRGRRTKGRKGVDYHHSEPTAPWKITNELGNLEDSASGTWKGTSPPKRKSEHDVISTEQKDVGTSSDSTDDDFYEDSDSEGSAQGEGQYEVEWSDWIECSVTCGTGKQSRYSRCVDDGSRLELCMEAGGERTETRTCNREACTTSTSTTTTSSATEVAGSGRTSPSLPDMFFPRLTSHTSPSPIAGRKQPDQHKHRKFHHKNTVYKSVAENSSSANVSELGLGKINEVVLSAQATRKPCSCQNGGMCHLKRRACHCPPGYFGRRCERVSCKPGCLNGGHCREPDQCVCPPHYTGPHCQSPVCQPPCLNGGVCLRPGVCSCPSGFLQPHCSPVCDPPCRYGGHCIKPNACHCPPGTSGAFCQNFSCRFACLNGGACVGPDQCECPRNATGATCADPVCDPPCENGATCSSGNRCLCDQGTSGTRCEKRKCEYQPYQEPYTRGYRRLVSRRYETKCEPWGWKTCVRNQPEYQTVYKTFYRTVYKCTDNHQ